MEKLDSIENKRRTQKVELAERFGKIERFGNPLEPKWEDTLGAAAAASPLTASHPSQTSPVG